MSAYTYEPKRAHGGHVETCKPEDAEFWGVYRLNSAGLPEHICDCLTENDAECVTEELHLLHDPCEKLVLAYGVEEDEAGVDWEDINDAWSLALRALRREPS